MTLNEFEYRLKQANPNLRIKRYGSAKAGVFYGNTYICRVPQGEITAYSVVRETIGYADHYKMPDNPLGAYKFDLIERRGRHAVARMLQARRHIKHADIAKIAS